jgi:hypothetical protein
MSSKIIKLSELIPDPNNANRGTPRGRGMLEKSLQKLGAGRSILVDKNNVAIAGNKTLETAVESGFEDAIIVESDGTKLVVVRHTDLDMTTDAKAQELAIADNRVGEVSLKWDTEILIELDEEIDLGDWFVEGELESMLAEMNTEMPDMGGAEGSAGDLPGKANGSLAEKFLVPPFSVLDARQGYWQKRKRQWLDLGIQSELGRGEP